ncbi:hypothetical protein FRB99_004420 [Tulasnella sp. 403]|nr:hypothetical protein FRB99_004420 [Tulasnella sp. 403]
MQIVVESDHSVSPVTDSPSPSSPSSASLTASLLDRRQRLIASLLSSHPSSAAVLDGSVDLSQDLYAEQVMLVPHSTGGYSDVHKAKLTRSGSNEIYVRRPFPSSNSASP